MKYLLTVQYRFDAFDDLEARQISNKELNCCDLETDERGEPICTNDVCFKLQEIKDNEPPRKIDL